MSPRKRSHITSKYRTRLLKIRDELKAKLLGLEALRREMTTGKRAK